MLMKYFITILSVVPVTLYFKLILKKYRLAVPMFLLFGFELAWIFVSLTYIEQGVWITEQARYSFGTGAIFRFALITMPFYVITPILLHWMIQKHEKRTTVRIMKICSDKFEKMILLLTSALIVYLLLDFVVSGTPLTNPNITKFNFYSNFSKLPFSQMLAGWPLNFLLICLGIVFYKKKRLLHTYPILLLLICFGIKILTGTKFYGIYTSLYYFFLYPMIMYFSDEKGIHRFLFLFETHISKNKLILYSALGTGGVAVIAIVMMKVLGSSDPINDVLDRFLALQGHSFWGIDFEAKQGHCGFSITQIKKEISSIFDKYSTLNNDIGLVRVMYMIAPEWLVNKFINLGARFSGGYWTTGVAVIGFFGTFIYSFVLALIYSYVLYRFYYSIRNKEYITIFAGTLIFNLIYMYFRVGNLSYLGDKYMFIGIAFYYFVDFIVHFDKKHARKE